MDRVQGCTCKIHHFWMQHTWIYQKTSLALVYSSVLDKIYLPVVLIFNQEVLWQNNSVFMKFWDTQALWPLLYWVAHRKKKIKSNLVFNSVINSWKMHLNQRFWGWISMRLNHRPGLSINREPCIDIRKIDRLSYWLSALFIYLWFEYSWDKTGGATCIGFVVTIPDV